VDRPIGCVVVHRRAHWRLCALARAVLSHRVFTKLAPLQKERIVRAPQAQGHVVGFTIFFVPISSIFDLTTFAVMWWVLGANSSELQSLFQSDWCIAGLLTQTLIVHMIRRRSRPCSKAMKRSR
jgi:magnesium-transporting ATPase (P-type)